MFQETEYLIFIFYKMHPKHGLFDLSVKGRRRTKSMDLIILIAVIIYCPSASIMSDYKALYNKRRK